ncbi:helix-turn-helix domain-containing protein [Novisyntrophococcus fermenticellae]|uniref:helix-turn-helix domain-containing protein n=1 Tax=Novisyntrophococcus fermenticellae TaxID=2068655 RepID=UPI001E52EDED|nr:helix-turn-helix domain-containing protein [Novisyntrophococcus fermenticellae]
MGKNDVLKENGTYNPNHAGVTALHFSSGIFFDSHDLIQVKYEMLRSVGSGECTVTQASRQYGLSRESFYNTRSAYEAGGLQALVPKKTGPKGAHKLTDKGRDFIDRYQVEHPGASTREINNRMKESTGIRVHNRTVERYLSKKHMGSR